MNFKPINKLFVCVVIILPTVLFSQEVDKYEAEEDSASLARRRAYEATLRLIEENKKRRERDPQRYADSLAKLKEERLYLKAQKRLKEYTDGDITQLTEIDLTGARLREVPDWVCGATDLEVLLLDNNQISSLPKALNELKKLERIYWRNNTLSDRKVKIPRMDGILKLDLTGNRLSKLPKIHRFGKLEELVLEENSFQKIPTWRSRRLKRLKELDLSSNPIIIDKRWYGLLDHIEILKLNKCELETIHPSFYRMVSLKELQVQMNNLTGIPDGISDLSGLTKLSFYKNNLSSLPDDLFELEELEVIDLYYNEIEKVPSDIEKLKNLKILYLSFNKLYDLPSSIGELTKLRALYIHHNRLSFIPSNVSNLKKLSVLHFQNNYLNEFPLSILQLSSLRDLDISDTDIKSVPLDLRLLNLKTLYWRHLDIDVNDPKSADTLSTLLFLQDNGVNVVPPISKKVVSED